MARKKEDTERCRMERRSNSEVRTRGRGLKLMKDIRKCRKFLNFWVTEVSPKVEIPVRGEEKKLETRPSLRIDKLKRRGNRDSRGIE